MPVDTRRLPKAVADLPLFAARPRPPGPRKVSLDAAFAAFHRANPWVYQQLVARARDLVRRGHKRLGIGMLFEVLRWQQMRRPNDPTSKFKLNNNLRSRYVRLIEEREPDLRGVFETRELRAR